MEPRSWDAGALVGYANEFAGANLFFLKTLFKNIFVPIYDFDVRVCLCDSIRVAVNDYNLHDEKHYNFVVEGEAFDPVGLWITKTRRGLLMFQRDHLSHGLIAHELRHAVDGIFEWREIKPSVCHETPALLHEFLAVQIYSCLTRWNATIK